MDIQPGRYFYAGREATASMDQLAFEENLVSGATLDDLDLKLVERHIEQARSGGRLLRPDDADSVESFLRYHRCVISLDGQTVPSSAGILFFGRDPQRWLPQAEFVLGHFPGEVATSQQARHLQRYGGTIPEQI